MRTDHGAYEKGVTLVELMISVSIFSIIAIFALSALSSFVGASDKVNASRQVMSELNTVLERMTRTIGYGTSYHCGDGSEQPYEEPLDCTAAQPVFAFEAQEGDSDRADDQIVYRLSSGAIERSEDGGDTFKRVTSQAIDIQHLSFRVEGNDVVGVHPRVLIALEGTAGVREGRTAEFSLQTTVSQRYTFSGSNIDSNPSEFVECPFTGGGDANTIIIDFANRRHGGTLLVRDADNALNSGCVTSDCVIDLKRPLSANEDHAYYRARGTRPPGIIPAREYIVSLSAYEENLEDQAGEKYYLELYNGSKTPIAHTSSSKDVWDCLNYPSEPCAPRNQEGPPGAYDLNPAYRSGSRRLVPPPDQPDFLRVNDGNTGADTITLTEPVRYVRYRKEPQHVGGSVVPLCAAFESLHHRSIEFKEF